MLKNRKKLYSKWQELVKLTKEAEKEKEILDILNKFMKNRYSNLDQITNKYKSLNESKDSKSSRIWEIIENLMEHVSFESNFINGIFDILVSGIKNVSVSTLRQTIIYGITWLTMILVRETFQKNSSLLDIPGVRKAVTAAINFLSKAATFLRYNKEDVGYGTLFEKYKTEESIIYKYLD